MLSAEIKQETREAHQALEAIVVRKLKSIAGTKDYAWLLEKFYGFYHPLEQQLHRFLDDEVVPLYSQRRRAGLILDDLQHLKTGVEKLSLSADLPLVDNVNKALGAFYVLEGSTQGGSIIASMLTKHAQMPATAISFFNAYGENEKDMWQSFRERLDQLPAGTAAATEVINAGKETFEKFHAWILQ